MFMVKQKIHDSTDISMRLELLTLAPTSWFIGKIQEFFQARKCQVNRSIFMSIGR